MQRAISRGIFAPAQPHALTASVRDFLSGAYGGLPDAAARPAVVTIKVPFALRKRRGRKLTLAPDGAPVPPAAPHVDSTLLKAIARAFRWQKMLETMLETGKYATIKEIARAEKINPSYVSRVLRLTLLAPATVEAILEGRASAGPTLAEAMGVFPVEWAEQQSDNEQRAVPGGETAPGQGGGRQSLAAALSRRSEPRPGRGRP